MPLLTSAFTSRNLAVVLRANEIIRKESGQNLRLYLDFSVVYLLADTLAVLWDTS